MTTPDKLNHIKARLRAVIQQEEFDEAVVGIYEPFRKLAAENWIEMIEGLEAIAKSILTNGYGTWEEHKARNMLEITIPHWESVYGEIKEEAR